jgi:hypothetical protein
MTTRAEKLKPFSVVDFNNLNVRASLFAQNFKSHLLETDPPKPEVGVLKT